MLAPKSTVYCLGACANNHALISCTIDEQLLSYQNPWGRPGVRVLCNCVEVLLAHQGQTQHAVENETLAKLATVYRACFPAPQHNTKQEKRQFRRAYTQAPTALRATPFPGKRHGGQRLLRELGLHGRPGARQGCVYARPRERCDQDSWMRTAKAGYIYIYQCAGCVH